MPKENDTVEVEGKVIEALPNTQFRVEIENQEDKQVILCYLAGKMRMYRIKVMPGDRVKVQLTPYDPNKGRIVFRLK